ncbi:MAG: hypothetical protein LYZ70_00040 [Nitrososphaerales archaeon]|nr:hypothetical protein [Nitrososphaerales archaeon]
MSRPLLVAGIAIALMILLPSVPSGHAIPVVRCLAPLKAPVVSIAGGVLSGQTVISESWANVCVTPFNVYMWVDVTDKVDYGVVVFLGSASVGARQNVTIDALLFNLPSSSCSCSAMIFATDLSGFVLSYTLLVSF